MNFKTVNFKTLFAAAIALAPVSAFAEAAPAAPGMGGMEQLVFLGGFIAIFYFMIWRPQAKRQKEHRALVDGLAKGDEVVTAGGLLGKVNKVQEEFILVEMSDGVEFPVQRSAVTAVLPKGTIKGIKA